MLNSVLYAGFRPREFTVDCVNPLAAPISIDACGPRRISAAMSTTYDTDMFDPLAIGSCTLNAEVSDDSMRKSRKGRMGANVARGRSKAKATAPRRMTPTMYKRARGGSSRSNGPSIGGPLACAKIAHPRRPAPNCASNCYKKIHADCELFQNIDGPGPVGVPLTP
jgi:hypothetical protein